MTSPSSSSHPAHSVREHRISFRVNTSERQQIESDAQRAGITIGAYIRQVLISAPVPRQSKRPSIEKKDLARLLGQIGKIGNNLNQLTRAANAYISINPNEIQAELNALKQLRIDIKQALGKHPNPSPSSSEPNPIETTQKVADLMDL